MSSTHKAYLEWSPEFFKNKALKHGVNVHDFVSSLFDNQSYPEVIYKRAMGVIQLHRIYGTERLNNACKLALDVGIHSYGRLKNILKNKRDVFVEEPDNQRASHIPTHSNLRGATNYK
ncbi:hypothetical protein [Xiashengella succiniciproducens]|uniref:Uncharacterized protein n=1 Tax=Xiashengella succiniciproducens TaxID=2949635 RepID=A0A9J6ZSH9_9BACT|nr:hypothetical protein [Alkaliflexus sp. Ai-910]URW78787.1 hypothetical protein M9189_07915 [Alkaliflexus sp. Ai-910]URW80545.1 hypothetical protein M9189_04175 [Alkaliflexus sp. Ai-910]URW80552.1 hypothetical protein M9189_04210 [Alkaliflexus sp. Ai-910]URW80781.1 hypothetical protein M9189_05375 [Alkaliflexus sp. Ai-910]